MKESPIALITGAGGGIGQAIASELASMGVNLMLAGRSQEKLQQCRSSLDAKGVRVEIAAIDFLEAEAADRLVDITVEAFGGLDILVNNAGIFHRAEVEFTDVNDLIKVMQVNALAPFLICKRAIPHLRASDRAAIINICSSAAHKGHINEGAYVSSKHALYGLTKTLANELAKDKIRVHALLPGGVDTEMASVAGVGLDRNSLISPREIADVVGFLLRIGDKGMIDEISLRRSGFC
ncbi:MAG: SDR family oxidoreductase [Verrucomicrobiota bacterium]